MPRNALRSGPGKRKNTEEHTKEFPDKVHADLDWAKQAACCKFWIYLATNGERGWSPANAPGSVKNLRSSIEISERIKERSWPKIGRVSDQSIVLLFSCCHSTSELLFSTENGHTCTTSE